MELAAASCHVTAGNGPDGRVAWDSEPSDWAADDEQKYLCSCGALGARGPAHSYGPMPKARCSQGRRRKHPPRIDDQTASHNVGGRLQLNVSVFGVPHHHNRTISASQHVLQSSRVLADEWIVDMDRADLVTERS